MSRTTRECCRLSPPRSAALVLLSLLVGSTPLVADPDETRGAESVELDAAATEQRAEGGRYGRGHLFAVTSPDGAVSHVFASLHDDAGTVLTLPRPVTRTLENSRFLLLTVRPDAMALTALREHQYLPAGEDLEGLLGTELYAWVARTLAEDGIEPASLRHWRPWVAIAALTSTPRIGPDHLHQRLHSRARRHGLLIHGLETTEARIERVDRLSEADQIGLLRHVLQRREGLAEERAARRQAWLEGDLAELRARYEQQLSGLDRSLREAFRENMGEGWQARLVQRVEPFLMSGGAFIALEGQHLAGPDGFLARLEARGFRVERRY